MNTGTKEIKFIRAIKNKEEERNFGLSKEIAI